MTAGAVALLGGCGYVRACLAGRMMPGVRITQICGGTDQVQRLVMARQVLSRRSSAPRDRGFP